MRLAKLQSKLGQTGDTIVEVIIVLAVLGFAISTSYATASRSLNSTRQAQENGHATQILQSQLETLRSYSLLPVSDPNNIFRLGDFCVAATGAVLTAVGSTCTFDTIYDVKVTYDPTFSSFTAVASWDDIGGQGKDTVTLVYRIHKPL